MMRCHVIETALGQVPVWVRGDPNGPLVVVIRGAFADEHDLEWMDIPATQFAFLHLPGFFSPPLLTTSIGAFTSAFTQALASVFPGKSYAAVGISTGAIVAMALPASSAVLAIEPFLSTNDLWPMHIYFQMKYGDRQSAEADWTEAIFGFRSTPRDYRGVLDGLTAPTTVLVGDQALLPQRRVRWMPSLCSDADRRMLVEHPKVHLRTVPGGHNLMVENPSSILQSLAGICAPTAW